VAPDEIAGTLRIAMFTDDDEVSDPRVQGFNEQYPDVAVEFLPISAVDWEDYFTKVLTEVAAGNPPDLVHVATEGTQLFAGQELGRPLDEFVQRDADELEEYFDDVHPALVEAMMYEGSLYQFPDDWNAANIYINTTLLEEAGLEMPGPDWTVEEFEEVARAIAEDSSADFGYGWTNRLWGSWMPWIFVNGGNLFTEERAPGGEWLWDRFYPDDPAAEGRGGGWRWEQPTANSPEVVEALEFVVRLRDEGITPAVEIGGGGLLEGLFASDQLGMTPAGGFWVGGLTSAGMEQGDFDVQLCPRWQSQRHQFGTAGFAMIAETENPEAAWAWIKHTIQREVMEQRPEHEALGTTPVRRSMVSEERYGEDGPDNWETFYATLDEHPDTAPIPAPPIANPMTEAFVRWTQLAVSGAETPQSAMDGLQADLEDILAAYGDQY
jgi:ABC-type glycerol-3-phosphate transport system substrate-binding protein